MKRTRKHPKNRPMPQRSMPYPLAPLRDVQFIQ